MYFSPGIPTLIILDEHNDVVTRDGRFEVLEDPEGEVTHIRLCPF